MRAMQGNTMQRGNSIYNQQLTPTVSMNSQNLVSVCVVPSSHC